MYSKGEQPAKYKCTAATANLSLNNPPCVHLLYFHADQVKYIAITYFSIS